VRQRAQLRQLLAAVLAPALAAVGGMAAGCRCEDPLLQPARQGFHPDRPAVDFGRVREGEQRSRPLRLVNTGRAEVAVRALAAPPFQVEPVVVALPAGGEGELTVLFTAGNGEVAAPLELSAAGAPAVTVELRGVGVRPFPCVASQICRTSTFDVESGACVEQPAPAGTSCVHPNPCLHNGVCDAAGRCEAEPRPCDDNNVCTADACSELVGCVHTAISCPVPANRCMVATCHPERGCGEAPAPSGTLCGAVDCVRANVCDRGACVPVPTPDGFPCSPPTPCQGPGTCQAQQCVQPDSGVFPPTFRLPLAGAPPTVQGEPGLVAHAGNLFAEVCGPAYDGGCALVSWTQNAFERFAIPHGEPHSVLSASDAGVWLLGGDALRLFGSGAVRPDGGGAPRGVLLAEVPLARLSPVPAGRAWSGVDRRAADESGAMWIAVSFEEPVDAGEVDAGEAVDAGDPDAGAPDAGLPPRQREIFARVFTDGGVELAAAAVPDGTEHRVAMTRAGEVFLFDPDAGLSRLWRDDAGTVTVLPVGAPGGGLPAVIAGRDRILAGDRFLYDLDGGLAGEVDWPAERVEELHGRTLLTPSGGFGFYRDGDGGLFALGFDPLDGGRRWLAPVLAPDQPGFLADAVAAVDGGLGTLVQYLTDAGTVAELQVYASGERVFACPLLPGTEIASSVFTPTFLHALVFRQDGGWALESYDLLGAPLDISGWPAPHGVAGTRRAH
jgi:hypothetical protein